MRLALSLALAVWRSVGSGDDPSPGTEVLDRAGAYILTRDGAYIVTR